MEEKREIRKVDLDVLSEHGNSHYSDGDIILFDNVSELAKGNAYLLDMVVLMITLDGRLEISINNTEWSARRGDMVICPPNTIVENIMISPDFRCHVLGLSYKAMEENMPIGKNMWNIMFYVTQNPVTHLEEEGMKLTSVYYDLLTMKLKYPNEQYYKHIMEALFQGLFFEFCSVIEPLLTTQPLENNMKHGELLCKRFIEILSQSEGRERSVTVFADKLCVTPKYLSTATKAASGKTALEWIHQFTMETIKRQLKYTNRSIKEIADDMNFSNLSFFGKFVRTQTGMSPTEFRKALLNDKKEL